jgi:broad specificity phosphatase PhoE
MPSILLIRHAQASFGAANYDVLSDCGREQVSALLAGLERRGIVADQVISGDLQRQRDTAQPYADALGLTVRIDPRWNEYSDRDILINHSSMLAGLERHPGDPELTSQQFQHVLNEALGRWMAAGAAGPAREPWPRFRDRVGAALEDVAGALGKGQTAVVVSSGGAIAAVTAALLGVPDEALIAFNHVSVNTGITKLAVGRSGTTLISSNEHGHLDEADGSLITYR